MNSDTAIRIDKWLWAARFFKTRSLASEAVNGGHVMINGERVKPSKGVQTGDRVSIRRESEQYEVTVTGLAGKRGSASVAQTLYEESDESIRARELLREQRRLQAAGTPAPSRRPDKRSRRHIIRFTRKSE